MAIRRKYWKKDAPPIERLVSANLTKGEVGWGLLALYVFLWDRYAAETLSRAFWRGVEHPMKRWLVVVAWGWVTVHLLFKRPRKLLVWW